MRNIIKVLLSEGIEREDVVAICKYIKEEYEVNEGLTSAIAPKLAGPSKNGKEESMGTKVERAGVKHPYLIKGAQKVDQVVDNIKTALQKKGPKYKSLDDALKTMRPAGSEYGQDMYSDEQVKYAKELLKKKVPTGKYIWQK